LSNANGNSGVVTNVCGEGFVRDYYIAAVDDGCAVYVQVDHMQAISNIDRFSGQVATMQDISAAWQP
jgi:arginine/ornithine N-succinyltransferase beta subunit